MAARCLHASAIVPSQSGAQPRPIAKQILFITIESFVVMVSVRRWKLDFFNPRETVSQNYPLEFRYPAVHVYDVVAVIHERVRAGGKAIQM